MTMAKQRVLITGGAGFIGSHVAARLANSGFDVYCCDNFNDYYSLKLKHGRVTAMLGPKEIDCENIELSDAGQVDSLFERVKPSIVIHLAAQAGVRYSLQNPAAYIQSNIVAFANIIEASRKSNVAHFMYASSSSVYGKNTSLPFMESDATDEPVSLYAATKKSNELMAYSYSHLYGLPTTGIRFFTVYGPWGRPDMAYFSFTEKMLNKKEINVFSGGELLRDFTYIDDVVEGVVRLLRRPPRAEMERPPHEIFNLGNNTPVKVLDFISMLEDVLDIKANIKFLPMQLGDVPATYAGNEKLRDWVGFVPNTLLETGLVSFREWYKEFHI